LEIYLLNPSSEKRAQAPIGEPFGASTARPLRHPIKALLALRALESLRYREFRLICYDQVFASMTTWDGFGCPWLAT
jgi:hypothetical protein